MDEWRLALLFSFYVFLEIKMQAEICSLHFNAFMNQSDSVQKLEGMLQAANFCNFAVGLLLEESSHNK